MHQTNKTLGFELSLSGRENGTLEAAYIRFKVGKVKRTVEVIEDALMADYDEHDDLLGFEILAPVKLSDLAKHVEQPRRSSFRRFVRYSAPAELVHV